MQETYREAKTQRNLDRALIERQSKQIVSLEEQVERLNERNDARSKAYIAMQVENERLMRRPCARNHREFCSTLA